MQPRRKPWIRVSPRTSIAILWAVVLSGATLFWYVAIKPRQEHARTYDRVSKLVDSLVNLRPAEVSRREWSYIIGWTRNGIGNCCSVPDYLNADDNSHERFRSLPDRFEQRLRDGASIETIDWFWDELKAISKYGERYSAQWRPTTPERLAEADRVTIGPEVP